MSNYPIPTTDKMKRVATLSLPKAGEAWAFGVAAILWASLMKSSRRSDPGGSSGSVGKRPSLAATTVATALSVATRAELIHMSNLHRLKVTVKIFFVTGNLRDSG